MANFLLHLPNNFRAFSVSASISSNGNSHRFSSSFWMKKKLLLERALLHFLGWRSLAACLTTYPPFIFLAEDSICRTLNEFLISRFCFTKFWSPLFDLARAAITIEFWVKLCSCVSVVILVLTYGLQDSIWWCCLVLVFGQKCDLSSIRLWET